MEVGDQVNNIAQLLKNPHMLAVVVALCALQIAEVWFPEYKVQLDQTRKLLMTYALLVAASMPPTTAQIVKSLEPVAAAAAQSGTGLGQAIAKAGTGDGGKP